MEKIFYLVYSKVINIIYSAIILLTVSAAGCKKFVEVGVPDFKQSRESVFSNNATAQEAVSGIYMDFVLKGFFVSLDGGLSADEFDDYTGTPDATQLDQNALLSSNSRVRNSWTDLYSNIYLCNSVLEGIAASSGVSDQLKTQFTAEALTWRALDYYYLVNFWGPVPLILSTDYMTNAKAGRASTDSIYARIASDLQTASEGLPKEYAGGEKIYLTYWANLGIQARIYACTQQWEKAESVTSEIISQPMFALTGLNDVFLRGSAEAIWQLQPQDIGMSTYEGSQFILESTPTQQALDQHLVSAFEPDDLRKTSWTGVVTVNGVDYAYPYKYKDKSAVSPLREYNMMLRLAELYLLRAEAKMHLEKFSESLQDINVLRARANLPDRTSTDPTSVLGDITHEHQVELFTELADRWIFLKRTGQIDAVMSPEKPGWESSDNLYPLPQTEIGRDANLTQNPGY